MTIQSELLAIKGESELLVPQEVLDWAKRHSDSEIYKALEWDNDKAAHEHRLWQIRRLIAVHITYESGVRRMVSLTIDRKQEGGGYRDINEVLASKSLHEVMLEDALRELDRMQLKYEQLKELTPIWKERDAIRSRRKRPPKAA